ALARLPGRLPAHDRPDGARAPPPRALLADRADGRERGLPQEDPPRGALRSLLQGRGEQDGRAPRRRAAGRPRGDQAPAPARAARAPRLDLRPPLGRPRRHAAPRATPRGPFDRRKALSRKGPFPEYR